MTDSGRVTELVARPLLNLYWPLLAGVIQPLSGEYAARRGLLERLPFPRGYGVEIGLLIDVLDARREIFDAEQQLVQTRRLELSNAVVLYTALGGGLT